MKKAVHLFAPREYFELTEGQRKQMCNGCGPGRILGAIIPDRIWGLNIKAACDIHDFMYIVGECIEDKFYADRVFQNNLVRIITAKSRFMWLRRRRLETAKFYYDVVSNYGGPWFWQNKNKPENMGVIT